MSTLKIKRLTIERKQLQKAYDKLGGADEHLKSKLWKIEPDGDNLLKHTATIIGPEDTPYAGQIYTLSISAEQNAYPSKPPKVRFTGTIPFHANVYENGNICVDILQSEWSAAYKMENILLSLLILLNVPNTSSPANPIASRAYDNDQTDDKREFAKLVEQHYNK